MWILSTVEELHHGRTHKKNNEFFTTFGWQLGGFFSWQERVKPMLNNNKWGLRNDAWHITRHPLAACHLPLDSILVQIYCQYDSFLTKQINIKFDNSAASSVDLSWSKASISWHLYRSSKMTRFFFTCIFSCISY